MGFFIDAFNILLYQPLFNFLVLIYKFIPDFGIAVIILTLLIRFLFYPLTIKAIRNQKVISELQPKVKEIQNKYKNNKEEQAKELLALYKKEKINPFSGILPLLIQLPVLIALYRVFWQGLQPEQMDLLYNFVSFPGAINPVFLKIVNLSKASLTLAFFAGILQYVQAKMTMAKKNPVPKNKENKIDFSQMMQKQVLYLFPFFTLLILMRLPAAIGLYWITTTLFTIGQQYILFRNKKINL